MLLTPNCAIVAAQWQTDQHVVLLRSVQMWIWVWSRERRRKEMKREQSIAVVAEIQRNALTFEWPNVLAYYHGVLIKQVCEGCLGAYQQGQYCMYQSAAADCLMRDDDLQSLTSGWPHHILYKYALRGEEVAFSAWNSVEGCLFPFASVSIKLRETLFVCEAFIKG